MVEIYTTEEEQVEAIKRWWDKNGKSVLILVVAVLASVFASQRWIEHRNGQAELASFMYQNMLDTIETQPQVADEKARALIGEFPDTTYAALAGMTLARLSMDKGEAEQAMAHLQWVIGNASDAALVDLAHLRLAKVQLQLNKPDDALKSIETVTTPAFRAEANELRGDSLLVQGKVNEAVAAYRNALSGYTDQPAKRSIVSMKLADLAASEES